MFTFARTGRTSGRLGLVAAVAALAAGTVLVRANDAPDDRQASGDITPIAKEHLLTKVPNFFSFDYPFEPQPGKRLWLRVDDAHWIERYPDGMESRFKVLGRTVARGESGTVVTKVEGDPEKTGTDNEGGFQVFIPDRGNKDMAILFRHVGGGSAEWMDMSWSENRKTVIQKVE